MHHSGKRPVVTYYTKRVDTASVRALYFPEWDKALYSPNLNLQPLLSSTDPNPQPVPSLKDLNLHLLFSSKGSANKKEPTRPNWDFSEPGKAAYQGLAFDVEGVYRKLL